MRADPLKGWLMEETHGKDPDTRWWETLISLTKLAFCEGCLYMMPTCTTIVLLPKVRGEYR